MSAADPSATVDGDVDIDARIAAAPWPGPGREGLRREGPDTANETAPPSSDDPPALEARLLVERVGVREPESTGARVLGLAKPGAVLEMVTTAGGARLELRTSRDRGEEEAACRLEVVDEGGQAGWGARVLVVPGRGQHTLAGGWYPDPPCVLLEEGDGLLWQPAPGGGWWSLHLVVFARALGSATPAESARDCPVCRQAVGRGRVYRCRCGACLHDGIGGEPEPGGAGTRDCARLAANCPVCQRPVDPAGSGYGGWPEGVSHEIPFEAAPEPGAPEGGGL